MGVRVCTMYTVRVCECANMCVCVLTRVCVWDFSLVDWLMLQHMYYSDLYLNGDNVVLRSV